MSNDKATCNLTLNGNTPKSISGYIQGTKAVTKFEYSRSYSSTIIQHVTTSAITTSVASDYREITVKRTQNSNTGQATIVNGIKVVSPSGTVKNFLSSTTPGAWITIKNSMDPDGYTEILGQYGSWS
ncbi:hypothetical protein AB7Z98_00775 [Providencia manganoxydans]|uniref:hypothetical protein n=1 Tax=Providencia manganoxydans TaxID=2923283 RepID=UPI0034E5EB55